MSDAAFTALVDQFYASLYRFALSLARNNTDACDLTQQTFLIWARKGQGLRDLSKAKTWLFTTLYREFLRTRRTSQRQTSLDDLPPGHPTLTEDDLDLVRRADASTVLIALGEVDEVYRAPLTLFYLEDLSYQEIADALDIPPGTVMSRLSRGKSQLRQLLQKPTNSRIVPFPKSERKVAP